MRGCLGEKSITRQVRRRMWEQDCKTGQREQTGCRCTYTVVNEKEENHWSYRQHHPPPLLSQLPVWWKQCHRCSCESGVSEVRDAESATGEPVLPEPLLLLFSRRIVSHNLRSNCCLLETELINEPIDGILFLHECMHVRGASSPPKWSCITSYLHQVAAIIKFQSTSRPVRPQRIPALIVVIGVCYCCRRCTAIFVRRQLACDQVPIRAPIFRQQVFSSYLLAFFQSRLFPFQWGSD